MKRISRRTLLRGAGVTLGLPWLEAMARAQTGAIKNPVRMAFLFFPNGVNVQHWYPKGEGREFELSPTLAPLEDYKQQIQVLSHLWNASAKGGDGHYAKDACFLTSAVIKKTPGVDLANATDSDVASGSAAADAMDRVRETTIKLVDGVDEATFYDLRALGKEQYSIVSVLENVASHDHEHLEQISRTLSTR